VHHFETLAAATTLPLIADSNPSRCAIGLSQETLETFSSIPSIVGLVGILGNGCSLNALAPHLRDRFTFLSNRDDTAVAFLSQSGDGIISAGANVHPRLFASMQQAARGGNICAALALEERLLPLMQALGVQGNPSAIKHAVHSGGNFSVHSKGKSMPSLHSRAPIAPLKREASVRFTIGQDKTGRWVVQDRDGRVGGIFTSEQAARHFAADECGHDAAQIAHARDGLVLQFTPLDGDSGSIH
jgi:dihydrodipicolinate synthase/N-acetylneuraminate lyase